jgi:replicative DNA helicase
MTDLISRTPPRDDDAERAVLGACLIDPEAIDVVTDSLTPEEFGHPGHAEILRAMLDLHKDLKPIELPSLKAAIESRGTLKQCGGATYLADLLDVIGTARNVPYYAGVVKDAATVRALIRVGGETVEDAFEGSGGAVALLDRAEARLFEVSQGTVAADEASPVSDLLGGVYRDWEAAKAGETRKATKSGLWAVDDVTGGFRPGEFVILAARPGAGKSALALTMALRMAGAGTRGLFFSLEMEKAMILTNAWGHLARVNTRHIREGSTNLHEEGLLLEAMDELEPLPLLIDDTASLTPMTLRSKARRVASRYRDDGGLGVIFIDYLQLMSGSDGRGRDGRQQEVSDISRTLKCLARELDVPVIALAQLSRKVEDRPDHRPRISDLRESGSLEQDADMILLLYREEYYDPENEAVKGKAEVIVGKNRNGRTGSAELRFVPEFVRFDEA